MKEKMDSELPPSPRLRRTGQRMVNLIISVSLMGDVIKGGDAKKL